MTSITLIVTGASIRAEVNGALTSGMVGIPVTIRYDDAWSGLTKNLVCRCGKWGPDKGETRTVLNIGETATVAHEVMQADMHLYLGIEGYSADGKLVIPTTWADCGRIQYGAVTGADPSADPKLSVWAQLQAQIKQIKQASITEEEIAAAVAAYLEENPIDGSDFAQNVVIDTTLTVEGAAADAKAVGNAIAEEAQARLGTEEALMALQYSAVKSVNGTAPDADGNVVISTGGGTASGWSTEEILLLETILKNCVTQADQTNNISTLIALLKSNSSGSEGSGGSGGDSGEDSGGDSGDSGNTTYSVVLNLTGVTASHTTSSVKSGGVYINQLSVGDGFELGTPSITMGGTDVTGQYYSGNGIISIPSVQGDIVITCKALAITPLTFVGLTGLPDTTFAYTTSAGLGQYNMIEDCGIVGGTLRLSWDTERITGGPGFHVYLFKDGAPYKIGGVNGANTTVDVIEGENIGTAYWYDPSACASGASRMIIPTAPCSVKIPAGCTAAVCLNKGSLALDGTNVANSTFGAFIREGNLTATMTEGG